MSRSAPLPVHHDHGPRPIARPFFLAGIAAVLTAGAGWGAWLLLGIAGAGSFTAPSVFAVNAHGQAQIYGWVGLFVLGFGFQAFPRFAGREALPRTLPLTALAAMTSGIALRSVAEPQAPAAPWPALALAGGVLELAAVVVFAAVVVRVLLGGGRRPEVADRWILSAVGWFVAAACFDLVHLFATVTAVGREALLRQIATYQFALRDLQIHGLAMMMILGVSLRILPGLFGLAAASVRRAARLLWPLNLAIAAEAVAFVVFMRTRSPLAAAVLGIATVLLATTAAAAAVNLRVFSRAAAPDRSLKFLRAAHVWLLVSLAMLVLAPLYFKVSGVHFSHAWYGAMRHAITVGFVSLTIMGVASRVAANLAGADPARLPRLWVPFGLVLGGCTLRVTMQVATDFAPGAFGVAGVSGVLELSGLAIWGGHLVRLLVTRRAAVLAGLRVTAGGGQTATAASPVRPA